MSRARKRNSGNPANRVAPIKASDRAEVVQMFQAMMGRKPSEEEIRGAVELSTLRNAPVEDYRKGEAWTLATVHASNPNATQGACFEIAGLYQKEHPDVILVHAIVGGNPHAWCELPEGILFAPNAATFAYTDEYRAIRKPTHEHRYTREEAIAEMAASEGGAEVLWADELRAFYGVSA